MRKVDKLTPWSVEVVVGSDGDSACWRREFLVIFYLEIVMTCCYMPGEVALT